MESHRIRETFLSFFEERDHKRVASASLIPPPEAGLLLTGAGMMQFIPYFLGQAEPPFLRAVSVQKCFRANDIENVGHTARHLTMFEMLGNFSFGDYFKAEAIAWAHELVTEGCGIDPTAVGHGLRDRRGGDRHLEDVGVPPERIVARTRQGSDNFWWTHAAGPAGPCSEIFVDRGPRYGPDGGPDVDEDRFMEIWNLVFMQEEVDDDAEDPPRAAGEEHRHRGERRARGDRPPGRGQRLRDRCVPAAARGGRVALAASGTAPTSATTSR